jgi:hypothetical protein
VGTSETGERSSRTIVLEARAPKWTWFTDIPTAATLGFIVPMVIVAIVWGGRRWFWVGVFYWFPPTHLAMNLVRTAVMTSRWHFAECMKRGAVFGSIPAVFYLVLYGWGGESIIHVEGIGYAGLLVGADVVVSIVVYAIVMAWWRFIGRRKVVQDGTLCYGCGYCLVGNTSMTCPECGRSFTLEELHQTPDAWSRLADSGLATG